MGDCWGNGESGHALEDSICGGAAMDSQLDEADPEVGWVKFAKFLMLLAMIGLFFWLGQSMVQHHFFTGGELNNRGAAVGP